MWIQSLRHRLRQAGLFMLVFLLVEWLDEFVFGFHEAAWPLIRTELHLNYAQIGLLFTIPSLVALVIEPVVFIWGAGTWRRRLLLMGGVGFACAMLLTGLSQNFTLLMLGMCVFFPSSGAFVGLSQTALMDAEPMRHEQNMARWTFAGSLGVVMGSLALGWAASRGLGWRPLFFVAFIITVVVLLAAGRMRFPKHTEEDDEEEGLLSGLRQAWTALRQWPVLRWLVLLTFSDLMLDVLLGYLALYFVDVVHVSEAEASLAVAVWTVVGLVGDALLIPLLERVRGLDYLRVSAVLEGVLYVGFLLIPSLPIKLVLLALLGFFNSGWYSILKGQLFTALTGKSGIAQAVDTIFGTLGAVLPFAIGLVADTYGLGIGMWLLLLGPLALIIGLWRVK